MVPSFESMLTTYYALETTTAFRSRTELEEACVRAAFRGWAEARTEVQWVDDAELVTRQYFRNELTPEVLESHEDGATNWALFASFAVGWLLALQTAGALDSVESLTAFATLPGFMWLHEVRITHGVG